MFDGPLFQKGRLKELQFSLKGMIHFNVMLQQFFSFNENKQ